ncbi:MULTISPECIES: hypothetical protein, partial [unclassified Neisseria]|uniref:hypothetical protein n=1 Tax=unclassified Neisseria TaxID=2623750 RepID=UPI001ADD89AF
RIAPLIQTGGQNRVAPRKELPKRIASLSDRGKNQKGVLWIIGAYRLLARQTGRNGSGRKHRAEGV